MDAAVGKRFGDFTEHLSSIVDGSLCNGTDDGEDDTFEWTDGFCW